MKSQLIAFAGAAVLSLAGASLAHAGQSADAWIAQAKAALDAKVADAGLADDGKTVAVRVTVTADPDDVTLRIVRSSGSQDFDSAAKAAAKSADLKRPPAELIGRTIVFTLGDAAPGPSAVASN